jgi:outer membrane protein assembly factor BamB
MVNARPSATPTGFSSFAVAEGRAFTIVGKKVDGVPREVCLALDTQTGKELWSTAFGVARYDGGGDSGTPDNKGGDGPRSTPAVSDGRIYLYGSGMNLVCLDARTGQNVWAKGIIQDFSGRNIRWQSAASPVVDGNLVFVAGGGPGQALLAFNKQTGALVWGTQDDGATHSTPVIADILGVRQIIFLTQRGLVALATKDGALLWRQEHPFRTSAGASPVVSGDIVFCSSGYGVGATAVKLSKAGNTFQAALLWRKPNQLMLHWSTPVAKDGFIYGLFGHASYGKAPLLCVDLATGDQKWSQPGFGPGGIILAGDQLIALADNGEVVTAKAAPDAYAETGRFKALAGKCWSVPAFSGGKIYLRSTTEGVCYEPAAK